MAEATNTSVAEVQQKIHNLRNQVVYCMYCVLCVKLTINLTSDLREPAIQDLLSRVDVVDRRSR
jgi:hypothetical protein